MGEKAAEYIMMEGAEVNAVVASGGAGETAEGYDLVTDDAAIVIPAPARVHVERTLVVNSPMVDSEAQTITVKIA